MKNRITEKKFIFALSMLIIFSSKSLLAYGPTEKSELSIGAGAIAKNNIRKNNEHENKRADVLVTGIPFIQFSYGIVSLGANGLSLKPFATKEFEAFINLNREGDRYDSTGMHSIHESFFTGAGIR